MTGRRLPFVARAFKQMPDGVLAYRANCPDPEPHTEHEFRHEGKVKGGGRYPLQWCSGTGVDPSTLR